MEGREGNSEAMREKKKREGGKCEELKMARRRRENGGERKREGIVQGKDQKEENNPREPAVVGRRGVHKPMHSNYFFLILCHCQASDCSCKLFVWQFW